MINLLFFISCLFHTKPKFEYTIIGTVDKTEKGICTVEIFDALMNKYSPTTIDIYSYNCKEGDIIAFGRKK